MKAYVMGLQISEGVSKSSGKPYSIGKLYAALPLVGDGARGLMGSEYQCEPAVLRKLDSVTLPAYCELEMQDVMRWGKRVQEIASISVLPNDPQPVRSSASTSVARATA